MEAFRLQYINIFMLTSSSGDFYAQKKKKKMFEKKGFRGYLYHV